MAQLVTHEDMQQVVELPIGKSYGGGRGLFRKMTLAEAQQLEHRSVQWFKALGGEAKQVTITSVKMWKRNPTLVQVNVRFGLHEYATFSNDDVDSRLLVPLTKEQVAEYKTWLQWTVEKAEREAGWDPNP